MVTSRKGLEGNRSEVTPSISIAGLLECKVCRNHEVVKDYIPRKTYKASPKTQVSGRPLFSSENKPGLSKDPESRATLFSWAELVPGSEASTHSHPLFSLPFVGYKHRNKTSKKHSLGIYEFQDLQ